MMCNLVIILISLFHYKIISDLFVFFHLHLLYQPYLVVMSNPSYKNTFNPDFWSSGKTAINPTKATFKKNMLTVMALGMEFFLVTHWPSSSTAYIIIHIHDGSMRTKCPQVSANCLSCYQIRFQLHIYRRYSGSREAIYDGYFGCRCR